MLIRRKRVTCKVLGGRKACALGVTAVVQYTEDPLEAPLTLCVAIPGLFHIRVRVFFTPGTATYRASGGLYERAHYGVWHDAYEATCRWKKRLDVPGPRGGFEKRINWFNRYGAPTEVIRTYSEVDTGSDGLVQTTFFTVYRNMRWWIPKQVSVRRTCLEGTDSDSPTNTEVIELIDS